MQVLYFGVMEMVGIVGAVLYCGVLINVLLQLGKCYINDEKYAASDFITETFILRWMTNWEKRETRGGETGNVIPVFLLGFLFIVLATIIWPITLTAIVLIVTLKSLRSVNRIKKRLCKLSKVAHKHLDKVDIEEFKD